MLCEDKSVLCKGCACVIGKQVAINFLDYNYRLCWLFLVKQVSLPILKQGISFTAQEKVEVPAAEQTEVKPEKQKEEKSMEKKPKKEKAEKKGKEKTTGTEGTNLTLSLPRSES